MHEVAYHQWPLFGGFRERPEFHAAYEEIYGYPFYLKAEKSAEEARSLLKTTKSEIVQDENLGQEVMQSIQAKRKVRPKSATNLKESAQQELAQAHEGSLQSQEAAATPILPSAAVEKTKARLKA
ncbi:hypothetical protein [Collimonas arenae]|uniref:hypothetical protein n=1 Tax=Collimonas arenae TaxID=279058 RepID=UPI00056EE8A7|nr:hypothetical protein [Collimonas arenae]